MVCKYCDDGEGNSIYPHYGVAPHICGYKLGHPVIGHSKQLPEFMWPANFKPDPESSSKVGDFPGAGVYLYCPTCKDGEQSDS